MRPAPALLALAPLIFAVGCGVFAFSNDDPIGVEPRGRIDNYLGDHGPYLWDGHLWFLDCDAKIAPETLTDVPQLPTEGPEPPEALAPAQVVKVDPDTVEPVGVLATQMRCWPEPALATGALWGDLLLADLTDGSSQSVGAANIRIDAYGDRVLVFERL